MDDKAYIIIDWTTVSCSYTGIKGYLQPLRSPIAIYQSSHFLYLSMKSFLLLLVLSSKGCMKSIHASLFGIDLMQPLLDRAEKRRKAYLVYYEYHLR